MKPLVSGLAEFLYDVDGTEYIDAISGVYNVSYGHAHPRIIEAIRGFPVDGILNCYANPTPEREMLEHELSELTGFSEVHLFSSGAETIEKALMLALRSVEVTRQGVLHFKNGFHGKTMGTYGLFDREMKYLLPYAHNSGGPPVTEEDEDEQLAAMRNTVRSDYGVVILESVMGYYGHVFSYRFLRGLKKVCEETGSVLIFDEMITSFGRTGVNFVSDVVKPDILVAGKGLGQGLPITAVLFQEDGAVNAKDFSWTTATSGNPLLCRVGLASCRVLVEEEMKKASLASGVALRRRLQDSSSAILETCSVFGIGSMTFVRKLAPGSMAHVEGRMRDTHHILTRVHGDTLVLMPPYKIRDSSIRAIVAALEECLK